MARMKVPWGEGWLLIAFWLVVLRERGKGRREVFTNTYARKHGEMCPGRQRGYNFNQSSNQFTSPRFQSNDIHPALSIFSQLSCEQKMYTYYPLYLCYTSAIRPWFHIDGRIKVLPCSECWAWVSPHKLHHSRSPLRS